MPPLSDVGRLKTAYQNRVRLHKLRDANPLIYRAVLVITDLRRPWERSVQPTTVQYHENRFCSGNELRLKTAAWHKTTHALRIVFRRQSTAEGML